MVDDPEIFRNALISLYGPDRYIDRFANKIGRNKKTVYKWLSGKSPVPRWAKQLLTLMIESKNDQRGTT